MKTLTDYLEMVKEKKGFEKDIELANYLGITKASLSVMKKGGGAAQETAERIANGAGVDLETIWLASLIQKEQNPKFKRVLENISKRSGIAASVFIAASLSAQGLEAPQGNELKAGNNSDSIYYVKL
ncbi:helix-turn-helix domain-containing protein [Methylobacter sp.]|uniref:helix-turn-helix domain-containing protein n=1 Tax=Methylobacter sp. TaxID=2051955 RepID=UPI003DA2D4B2